MWKVSLPLKAPVSKKSFFSINLNVYRNAHYQTLNKAKVVFKEIVTPLLKDIPKLQGCSLKYILYPKTNRPLDVANVCAVIDKFFSDAFVESGHLIDDNFNFIKNISFSFGGVDPLNPRVDVYITETINKEDNMRIILENNEIMSAVTDYVKNNLNMKDKQFIVTLRANAEEIIADVAVNENKITTPIEEKPIEQVVEEVKPVQEAVQQVQQEVPQEPKEETRSLFKKLKHVNNL